VQRVPARARGLDPAVQAGRRREGDPGKRSRENAPGQLKAAPAPLLGAGLPGLGIAVGYGAYWLARRRRNNAL